MNKPIIAVTPLYDDDLNSIWMLSDYLEGIYSVGGIPVILPLNMMEEDIADLAVKFDGFLFTGGQDVSPELYGEEIMDFCDGTNSSRDTLESILLKDVLKHDKPILGICRGLQLINATLGGTLYQDMGIQHKSEIKIIHKQEAPYNVPCHSVEVLQRTPLHSIVKTHELQVNSIHHQAIKVLSPELKASAVSKDGIVESAYIPDRKFVLGVQWHPEFLYKRDSSAMDIFRAFVENC